ncbi:hypothetical protein B0J12DRAFT_448407 [Macrophomina phaseolina]|uniref:Uncharacterized protein n=1 Tax=Macrophomina phaseolina TaxID=35725 RepID=A0ABQ8GFJ1_9PEZI|nr:hypothetical protein B0J12DRAFT_448407 [Macrophomina phaseolina]
MGVKRQPHARQPGRRQAESAGRRVALLLERRVTSPRSWHINCQPRRRQRAQHCPSQGSATEAPLALREMNALIVSQLGGSSARANRREQARRRRRKRRRWTCRAAPAPRFTIMSAHRSTTAQHCTHAVLACRQPPPAAALQTARRPPAQPARGADAGQAKSPSRLVYPQRFRTKSKRGCALWRRDDAVGKAGMSWALSAGYLCAVCQGDSSGDPSCLRSTCTPHVFPGLKRTFLIPIVIFSCPPTAALALPLLAFPRILSLL